MIFVGEVSVGEKIKEPLCGGKVYAEIGGMRVKLVKGVEKKLAQRWAC